MNQHTIPKKKKEEIMRFAEELDSINDKYEPLDFISIEENLAIEDRWRRISPGFLIYHASKITPEKQADTKPDDKVLSSVKNLETKIEDLEKIFDISTKNMERRLIRIEEMICDEDDTEVIEIKDYTNDEARKIIEEHLKKAKRKVPIEEFVLEFGIDLSLVNKIFTDLLREGKVE